MNKIQLLLAGLFGLFLGSLFQRLYDLNHLAELKKQKQALRENSQHGLIYLIPWTGKFINIHNKENRPKQYRWRYPAKHGGGRPVDKELDAIDQQALQLVYDGKGLDEAFDILSSEYKKCFLARNPDIKYFAPSDVNLMKDAYRQRMKNKLGENYP